MNDYKSKRSDSILTPEIRWAYPNVHEQSTTRGNGKPRKAPVWVMTGLMPKLNTDPLQCSNYRFLSDLCMQAVTREPAWNGQFPAGGHWPVKDGDQPPRSVPVMPGTPQAAVDPNKGLWRKGNWFFEVTTTFSPPRVCVMQNGQAVEIPAKVVNGRTMYKSGDFGIGSIQAYTFFNEKWGVSLSFDGILWTREGEAIGSSGPRSAAQMFGSVAGMAAPSVAPIPPSVPLPPSTPQQTYTPPVAPAAPMATPVVPVTAPSLAPAPLPPGPPAMAPAGLPPIPGR